MSKRRVQNKNRFDEDDMDFHPKHHQSNKILEKRIQQAMRTKNYEEIEDLEDQYS